MTDVSESSPLRMKELLAKSKQLRAQAEELGEIAYELKKEAGRLAREARVINGRPREDIRRAKS
jgi:hypothetical protein